MSTGTATRQLAGEHPEGLCDSEMASTHQRQDFGLSSRERDVLQLIADGLADKEIGVALGISRFTVSKHVCAIMRKIEVTSRTHAAVRALRAGVVT